MVQPFAGDAADTMSVVFATAVKELIGDYAPAGSHLLSSIVEETLNNVKATCIQRLA